MKNILLSLSVIATLIFGFQSCSEDFEVSAPYKDITLVYGLLNMNDTAHYVRIQKAFLDENKNAFDMAKEADSNFFKENELNVQMKEISGGNVISVTDLNRVNLNDEGYRKEPGDFFTSPNYGYKFKKALNPANRYRLVITNTTSGNVDSSEINIVDATPTQFRVTTLDSAFFRIAFSRTINQTKSQFSGFVPVNSARFAEGIITFHWVDKNISTGVQTDKSADFRFANFNITQAFFNVQVLNTAFYSFLKEAMTTAPAGVERYMDSCDFYLYAGGEELYNYLVVTQSQSSGLTADQLQPTFTNILGKDALGIFSSRAYKRKLEIPFDNATLDSLKVNPVTSDLNIIDISDH